MSMSSPTFEEHVNEMVMNQLGALRKLRSPLTSYVASAIYIVLLCHWLLWYLLEKCGIYSGWKIWKASEEWTEGRAIREGHDNNPVSPTN